LSGAVAFSINKSRPANTAAQEANGHQDRRKYGRGSTIRATTPTAASRAS
jgi:hypothetical protein